MTFQTEPVIQHLGLLVLDVQAAFLKAFQNPDLFLGRVKFCVETCNLFNLPAVFTEQRPEILGHTLEDLLTLSPGSPCISKTGFSAFAERALTEWLESHSIHHLLVIGLETPICVYQSALDALNQDLEITLLSDAVGGRRKDDAPPVFASLRIHGAHILPSETVFYSILKNSKHPLFREYTQLVKKYSD